MEKIWFILIEGNREGPYSVEELRADSRITPDMWVWRDGFEDWKKIRDVPELKELFKDEPEEKPADDTSFSTGIKKGMEDELTLDMRQDPSYFLWLLIALIALLYVVLRLYVK